MSRTKLRDVFLICRTGGAHRSPVLFLAKIFAMYLAGYTMQEIADVIGLDKANISREIENLLQFSSLGRTQQVSANFQDSEFETPIAYQVNASF